MLPFDLSTPSEIFRGTRLADGRAPYRVTVCGVARSIETLDFRIRFRAGLEALERADTVIVPGIDDIERPVPRLLVEALRRAAARKTRLASICSGAFLLAATGLLAGKRATTHWRAAGELARRHPAIDVDPNVLFVDEGQLLTSAGATAGIDLCLHLVRRDFGAAVAAETARIAVVAPRREGGQAQYILHAAPASEHESLSPLLTWIEQSLRRDLSLSGLARRAAMSTRTLSRRFREQTGSTPAQWVALVRVRRAQALLETTGHSVERVANLVGFPSTATLQVQFRRILATSPKAYRRAFRGS